jgi:predicted nucleic acid-binding protein
VTRYLLDTNIISNVTKPNPSTALVVWMAERADNDLCGWRQSRSRLGSNGRRLGFLRWVDQGLLGNLSSPPMATFTDRDQDYP